MTTGIFGIITIFPILVSFFLMLILSIRIKQRFAVYFAISWFFYTIWRVLTVIDYFYFTYWIPLITTLITVPLALFLIIFLDEIDHQSIDAWKLVIIAIFATGKVFFLLRDDAFYEVEFNGLIYYEQSTSFLIWSALMMLFTGIVYLFLFIKINRKANLNLKKYSRIALCGGLFMGIIAPLIAIVFNIDLIIDLATGLGAILTAYAFYRCPKLAFILPFDILGISIIDKGGIPLYMHKNSSFTNVDDILYSGALFGLSSLMDELLNRGQLTEIYVQNAVLMFRKLSQHQITCVLLSTRSSRTLNDILNSIVIQLKRAFETNSYSSIDISVNNWISLIVKNQLDFIPFN